MVAPRHVKLNSTLLAYSPRVVSRPFAEETACIAVLPRRCWASLRPELGGEPLVIEHDEHLGRLRIGDTGCLGNVGNTIYTTDCPQMRLCPARQNVLGDDLRRTRPRHPTDR